MSKKGICIITLLFLINACRESKTLTIGLNYNLYSLDAISGIISSIIITKWAIELIRDSGKELIEFKRMK